MGRKREGCERGVWGVQSGGEWDLAWVNIWGVHKG